MEVAVGVEVAAWLLESNSFVALGTSLGGLEVLRTLGH